MPSIRTLLVEDDVERARLIQARLRFRRDGRFDVEHRATLDQALARLREGDLDFVLLGSELPGTSRVEALDRIRAVDPHVPVLVISDDDKAERALTAIQARAQEVLANGRADERRLAHAIRSSLESDISRSR